MIRCTPVLLALLAVAAPLPGQAPSPWTAEEATIAAILPMLARGEPVPSGARRPGGNQVAGYQWARLEVPATAGPGSVHYAWPVGRSGRAFAITDRGVLMFTEDRTQPYGEGECKPAWSALVGKGAPLRLDQALTMPGRGHDDQFWQPVAMVPAQKLRIAVVDDEGQPVPGVTVAVGERTWFGVFSCVQLGDEPVPAGSADTDPRGEAVVTGVAAKDLWAGLAAGGLPLPVRLRIDRQDGVVRILVDGDEVSQRLHAAANANESAAIATLKNLCSAQAQLQASGANDKNANGSGEYGFFAQLSGWADVATPAAPGGETKLRPPVLSSAFGNVQASCVRRSGYVFQVFLPGTDGWLAEAPFGGAAGIPVDPGRAETLWCAYAWPVKPGAHGNRVFYIDQGGDLLAAHITDGRYAGTAKRPAAGAAQVGAFREARAAANKEGNDGLRWIVVQ